MSEAELSPPWPLVVAVAKLPRTGLGVLTNKDLPTCYKFGPFRGSNWKTLKAARKPELSNRNATASRNWMRYINCPRNAEEVNLVAFQYSHNMYYLTIKPVTEGSELLVWYRDDYGKAVLSSTSSMTHNTTAGTYDETLTYCFGDFLVNTKNFLPRRLTVIPSCSNRPTTSADQSSTFITMQEEMFSEGEVERHQSLPSIQQKKEYIPTPCQEPFLVENDSSSKEVIDINSVLQNSTQDFQMNLEKRKCHCIYCIYATEHRNIFKMHMGEDMGNLLPCQLLNLVTAHSSNQETVLQCDQCDYRTARSDHLKLHMRKHTGELLECEYCDYKTVRSDKLKLHLLKHTGELLECEQCDYKTVHSDNLKEHMRKHTGDLLECEQCDYKTARTANLKQHIRKHTGDLQKCDQCDYKTVRSDKLKQHMRKHTGETFQCEQCDYSTIRSDNLKQHMRKHTGDLQKCDQCDYKTAYSSDLKQHMRKHTGELFQCKQCDYSTIRLDNLKQHIRKHTGELHQCDQCDYTSVRLESLKTHMLKHKGELLQCEKCDYRTVRADNMKQHIRKHTGEFQQCDQCDYKTVYPRDLKQHMRKHTGELLQCKQCDYTTAYTSGLKRHMLKHTGKLT